MASPRFLFLDLFDTLIWLDEARYVEGKRRSSEYCGVDYGTFAAAWRGAASDAQVGVLRDTESRVHRVLAELGVTPGPSAIGRIAREDHLSLVEGTFLIPGALDMLDEAKHRGLITALISNASPGTRAAFEHHHLDERMDAVSFSFDVGARKPDPAIYRHALEALRAQPADVVYCGDGDSRELEGAKALGMKTVLVDFPERNPHHLDAASRSANFDHRITRWAGLWDLPLW